MRPLVVSASAMIRSPVAPAATTLSELKVANGRTGAIAIAPDGRASSRNRPIQGDLA